MPVEKNLEIPLLFDNNREKRFVENPQSGGTAEIEGPLGGIRGKGIFALSERSCPAKKGLLFLDRKEVTPQLPVALSLTRRW